MPSSTPSLEKKTSIDSSSSALHDVLDEKNSLKFPSQDVRCLYWIPDSFTIDRWPLSIYALESSDAYKKAISWYGSAQQGSHFTIIHERWQKTEHFAWRFLWLPTCAILVCNWYRRRTLSFLFLSWRERWCTICKRSRPEVDQWNMPQKAWGWIPRTNRLSTPKTVA